MRKLQIVLAALLALAALPFPCRGGERSRRADPATEIAIAEAEVAARRKPKVDPVEPVAPPAHDHEKMELRKEVKRLKAVTARQRAAARIRRDCGCSGHGDCTCSRGRCNCLPCHPKTVTTKRVPAKRKARPKQTTLRQAFRAVTAPICRA